MQAATTYWPAGHTRQLPHVGLFWTALKLRPGAHASHTVSLAEVQSAKTLDPGEHGEQARQADLDDAEATML